MAAPAQRIEGAPLAVPDDPWVLSAERPDYGATSAARAAPDPARLGPYLGNGRLGQRVDVAGGLFHGAPLPSYLAGHYPSEALAALPPLFPISMAAGGKSFGEELGSIHDYRQEVRLKHGQVVTRGVWAPGIGEIDFGISAQCLRHRPDTALLRLTLNNRSSGPVIIGIPSRAFKGARAGRSGAGVTWSSDGVSAAVRLTVLDRSDLATDPPDKENLVSIGLPAGERAVFAIVTRVATGARTPGMPTLDSRGVEAEIAAHQGGWERLWKSDIQIEGDDEAQLAVRACLHQLFSSLREGSDAGVPPMGLSAGTFQGHVFWDMDSWILPAMLPQHPRLAAGMLDYRLRTLPGARANARAEGLPGASFAWESAATGRETLLKEVFRHGRHVTGDVALALAQYRSAVGPKGDADRRFWPLLKDTADNWVARAKPDGSGGFVIEGVTTPDENAGLVRHSAWTHYVARVNLELAAEVAVAQGRAPDPRWLKVARGLGFLRDENKVILAYEGFKPTTRAKQADALLLIFPGEAPLSLPDRQKLYDHYSSRVIATGPAMTEAVHAVAAARLGLGDAALAHFQRSFRPFLRPPYLLFSEKRTRDNLCFVTGAAGVVEAVLYGFAGLSLRSRSADRPLIEPHLPPGWSRLRVNRIQWRGRAWDLELRPGRKPAWTPAGGS